MLRITLLVRALVILVVSTTAVALFGQTERLVSTAKGERIETPIPHPLSWWTHDPLRLDEDHELMIGDPKLPGSVPKSHYAVRQRVSNIGTAAGHRIVQVITLIRERDASDADYEWKSLLVQSGSANQYVEVYRLQAEFGSYQPFKSAAIYGAGPNAILGTYDRDSGNGGGCTEGYWWFDGSGAHPVDFTPLWQAIGRVTPANSTYQPGCYALKPERSEVDAYVRQADAKCHACGWIGEVKARYRIEHGAAIPVEVHFQPKEDGKQ